MMAQEVGSGASDPQQAASGQKKKEVGGDSHEEREPRESASRDGAAMSAATAQASPSRLNLEPAPQPSKPSESGESAGGAERQERQEAAVVGLAGPDTGDAGILPQLPSGMNRQEGQGHSAKIASSSTDEVVTRPPPLSILAAPTEDSGGAEAAATHAAHAARATLAAQHSDAGDEGHEGHEGLGASAADEEKFEVVGGLGAAADSEFEEHKGNGGNGGNEVSTPALIHPHQVSGSDHPASAVPDEGRDTQNGQVAVTANPAKDEMDVDDDPVATKEAGKTKPAMFAYANTGAPPSAPRAPRGLASLPARPSAPSFRTRAPLPSQNDSYATVFGAPPPTRNRRDNHSSHNDSGKEGPRGVDRSALSSLIFSISTTPSAASELLQLPLPSRRQTRRATGAGVLIPVERLPLLPLPPLPPILDKKLEKVVFSHQSLFPRDAGVFEYPVKVIGEGGMGEWEGGVPHYEKLEHVGDAILGGVVTTWLHRCWPGLTCGTATVSLPAYPGEELANARPQKLKAHLVSNNTLSHLSGMYHLPARLACAPLLRVQTDIRAALVEAYIAGVYFSHPPGAGIGIVTEWLEEMYAPLADFFLQHMRGEYAVLRATVGTSEGRVVTHRRHTSSIPANPSLAVPDATTAVESSSEDKGGDMSGADDGSPSQLKINAEPGGRGTVSQPDALEAADERLRPALTALSAYCKETRTTLEFREKRFRLSSGTLWKISVVVGGAERGEGMRVTKYRARWVAAAQACAELGIGWEPEEVGKAVSGGTG